MSRHDITPERKAEIEKEKNKERAKLKDVEVSDIKEQVISDKGERYFLGKFNEIYSTVRPALVLLAKKRRLGLKTSEQAYTEAIELMESYSNSEE